MRKTTTRKKTTTRTKTTVPKTMSFELRVPVRNVTAAMARKIKANARKTLKGVKIVKL
jgi:hypothetical protein